MEKNKQNIEAPSVEQVEKYLKGWEGLTNYVEQEKALQLLFGQTFPNNNSMAEVLVKVATLNTFYSTNIRRPFMVAKHVVALNTDGRLKQGDISLVKDIACGHGVKSENGNEYYYYSFASKYCSFHHPQAFPIYDNFVGKVLLHFKDRDGFYSFADKDLKDYPTYKEIYAQFRRHYGLEQYSLKQLDRYLWQLGKEYFSHYPKEVND